MKNFPIKPFITAVVGFILGVLALLPAFIPLIRGHELDSEKSLEIALGLLILWATQVITAFVLQADLAAEMRKEIENVQQNSESARERLLEALKVDRMLYVEPWLSEKMQRMVKLLGEADQNIHLLHAFKEAIDLHMTNTAMALRTCKFSYNFPKETESHRQSRMKEIIERAQDYVYAVTFDGGEYIQELWLGELSDDYLSANISVQKREAELRRAFVLDEEVLKDSNSPKCVALKKAVNAHIKNNIKFFVVFKNNLPSQWNGHDTSFLVCDDYIVSESYTLSDDGKTHGHETVTDPANRDPNTNRALKLKNLFKLLESVPDQSDRLLTTLGIKVPHVT